MAMAVDTVFMGTEPGKTSAEKGAGSRSGAWALAVAVSLAVNLALFSVMPLLTRRDGAQAPPPLALNPVDVVRIKRQEAPPRREKPKPTPRPEEMKKAPEQLKTETMPVNMRPPSLPFEFNPSLPSMQGDIRVDPDIGRIDLSAPLTRAPAGPPMPSRFEAGELDGPLQVRVRVPPVYPYRAKRREIEGQVTVRFVVSENGVVEEVEILEAQPEGVFEQSVRNCVLAWRFSPPRKDGRAVSAWKKTTIRFELE